MPFDSRNMNRMLSETYSQGIPNTSRTVTYKPLNASKTNNPFRANKLNFNKKKAVKDEGRSTLDRLFDMMLVGNYASAGLAKGTLDYLQGDSKDALNGLTLAKEGIKASNPFGNGNSKHEYSYSKVLEDAGWKPKSLGGRFARGLTGFALDVVLDPTSYLTLGASNLIKGAGKLPKGVEALSKARALDVVANSRIAKGLGMSADDIARDAEKLVTNFNKTVGVSRKSKPVTIGVGNLPFANPEKVITLGSGETIQKVSSKLHLDTPYSLLRDKVYGSKLADKFSNRAGLYKLAKEKPDLFYEALKHAEVTNGRTMSLLQKKKSIRDYVKGLDLNESDSRDLLEAMQDKTIWTPVKQFLRLSQTAEGKEYKKALELWKEDAHKSIDDTLTLKKNLEAKRANREMKLGQVDDELSKLESEYQQRLNELDLTHATDKKRVSEIIKLKEDEANRLYAEFEGVQEPVKPEPSVFEGSVPKAPRKPNQVKDPVKPNIPDVPKDELKLPEAPVMKSLDDVQKEVVPKPELEHIPTFKKGIPPRLEDFTDDVKGELPYEQRVQLRQNIMEQWRDKSNWDVLEDGSRNFKNKIELIDELSLLIFGEKGHISYATFGDAIEGLVKRLENGQAIGALVEEIMARPHMYDGRSADIYSYVAEVLGYGKGTRWDSKWEKYYTERVTKFKEKIESGKSLTFNEKQILERLISDNQKRALLVKEMKGMTHEEIAMLLQKHIDDTLEQEYIKTLQDSVSDPGYEAWWYDTTDKSWKVKRGGNKYRSEDEILQDRRNRMIDEDSALGSEQSRRDVTKSASKLPKGVEPSDLKQMPVEKKNPYTGKMETVFKPHFQDSISGEWIEYIPASKSKSTGIGKDLRSNEFNDNTPYSYQLIRKDKFEARKMILDVFGHKKGELLTSETFQDMQRILTILPDVLKESFKRDFAKLTQKQKRLAVDMAYQKMIVERQLKKDSYFAKESGIAESVDKLEQKIKKKAEAELLARKRSEVEKTVLRHTEIGDSVAFKKQNGKGSSGVIKNITRDEFDNVVFEVESAFDGLVKVSPADVTHTRRRKISELLLDDASKSEAELAYEEAMKEYELESKIRQRVVYDVAKRNQEKQAKYQDELKRAEEEYKARQASVRIENFKNKVDYDNEVKRLTDEHNAKYADMEKANQEALAQYEKELADANAKRERYQVNYEKRMEKYKEELQVYNTQKSAVEILNQMNLEEYEQKMNEYSRITREFMENKQRISDELSSLQEQFKQLDSDLYKQLGDLKREYDGNKVKILTNAKRMEAEILMADEALRTGDIADLPRRVEELQKVEDALSDTIAFETYMESQIGKARVNAILKKRSHPDAGKIVLDTRPYSDKVKTIAKELRGYLVQIGEDEVEIGKLNFEAFSKNMLDYTPHIPTPEGQYLLDNYKVMTNKKTGVMRKVAKERGVKTTRVTDDFGYGEVWNNFGMSRTIKSIKLNGVTIHNPTIQQINEAFKPLLNGKNLFSENMADIYMARAIKHAELMYDDKYMNNMLELFGKPVNPDTFIPDEGYKVVMNHGVFIDTMRQMSSLNVRMDLMDATKRYIEENIGLLENEVERYMQNGMSYDIAKDKVFGGAIKKFMKENYPSDVTKRMYDDYFNFGKTLLNEHFDEVSTPMLELDSNIAKNVERWYESSVLDFQQRLENRRGWLERNGGTSGDFERLIDMEKVFADIRPLQIKQVNEVIVERANQARKLQIAKDEKVALQLFDKFQHWIKLMQTTVLPSFHARNFVSNKYLNWLGVGRDALNPRMNAMAYAIMKEKGDIGRLKELGESSDMWKKILQPVVVGNGKVYQLDEIYDLAVTHGVVDEGFFAVEMGAKNAVEGKLPIRKSLDPTDTENFYPFRKGAEFGNTIENTDRLVHFISMLRQGHTIEESAESVQKYLFDYSDLTSFERTVMKRIFPYYTWLRKNGRLQLTEWMEQPGKYRDTAKSMNMIEGGVNEDEKIDRNYVSDFAKNWKQTPFWHTNEDGNREPVLWNPNLPFMDLTRLPDPTNLVESTKQMFSQSTPIAKVPIEQALNKNFFFDDRIVDENDSTTEALIKRAKHIASQNGLFTAGEGFVNKNGLDRVLHGLNQITGQKFLSYDYETSKNMAMAKYAQQQSGDYSDELPIDTALRYIENAEKKLHQLPSLVSGVAKNYINEKFGGIMIVTDAWLNGAVIDEDVERKYKPFIDAYRNTSKTFGIEEAKLKKFTWAVMDVSGFEGLLGKDFETGRVVNVTDGDTFDVKINGHTRTVRLLNVDTPETVDPDISIPMPYGKEASNFTKEQLTGKDIRIVIDTTQQDAHGRLLAYVYHNGEDYNKKLLQQGLGKIRYVSGEGDYYKLDDYWKAQFEANKSRTGLWGVDGYASPTTDSGYSMDVARQYLRMKNGQ